MVRPTFVSWWRGAVVVGIAAVGALGAAVPADAAASSATTTSSTLTLAQWKTQYEPAVGQIADDVDVVVKTGVKDAKHPTKKEAKSMVAACQTWHADAVKLPVEVPPIPVATAEKMWQQLVTASLSGSADCTAALQHGVTSVTKDFRKQLVRVRSAEQGLITELGTSTQ
jgi:hypothetical protein